MPDRLLHRLLAWLLERRVLLELLARRLLTPLWPLSLCTADGLFRWL